MVGLGGMRGVHGHEVRPLQELEQACYRLHIGLRHLQLSNEGVVGNDAQSEYMAAPSDRLGNIAERNQTNRAAPHSRNVIVVWPPLAPAPVLGHLVHQQKAPVGCQQQHHGVVGNLVNKDVGDVGDHDVVVGGRIDIDEVGSDAAQADDDAPVQAGDDIAIHIAASGDQRIGIVPGGLDELVVALGRHFDDLGADRVQRLPFHRESRLRPVVRGAGLRLDHYRVVAVSHVSYSSSKGMQVGPDSILERRLRQSVLRHGPPKPAPRPG